MDKDWRAEIVESLGKIAQATQEDAPQLYSVTETARMLGMSTSWTWNAVKSGALPSVRLGKRVLVERRALETLISEAAA